MPADILIKVFGMVYDDIEGTPSYALFRALNRENLSAPESVIVRCSNADFAPLVLICKGLQRVTTAQLYKNLAFRNCVVSAETFIRNRAQEPQRYGWERRDQIFIRQSILLHRTLRETSQLRGLCRNLMVWDMRGGCSSERRRPTLPSCFASLTNIKKSSAIAQLVDSAIEGHGSNADLFTVMSPMVDDIVAWSSHAQELLLLMRAKDPKAWVYPLLERAAFSMPLLTDLKNSEVSAADMDMSDLRTSIWPCHGPRPSTRKIVRTLQNPLAKCQTRSFTSIFHAKPYVEEQPINHHPDEDLMTLGPLGLKQAHCIEYWGHSTCAEYRGSLTTFFSSIFSQAAQGVGNPSSSRALANDRGHRFRRNLLGASLGGSVPNPHCPKARQTLSEDTADYVPHLQALPTSTFMRLFSPKLEMIVWRIGPMCSMSLALDGFWAWMLHAFADQRLVFPNFKHMHVELIPWEPTWAESVQRFEASIWDQLGELTTEIGEKGVELTWDRPPAS